MKNKPNLIHGSKRYPSFISVSSFPSSGAPSSFSSSSSVFFSSSHHHHYHRRHLLFLPYPPRLFAREKTGTPFAKKKKLLLFCEALSILTCRPALALAANRARLSRSTWTRGTASVLGVPARYWAWPAPSHWVPPPSQKPSDTGGQRARAQKERVRAQSTSSFQVLFLPFPSFPLSWAHHRLPLPPRPPRPPLQTSPTLRACAVRHLLQLVALVLRAEFSPIGIFPTFFFLFFICPLIFFFSFRFVHPLRGCAESVWVQDDSKGCFLHLFLGRFPTTSPTTLYTTTQRRCCHLDSPPPSLFNLAFTAATLRFRALRTKTKTARTSQHDFRPLPGVQFSGHKRARTPLPFGPPRSCQQAVRAEIADVVVAQAFEDRISAPRCHSTALLASRQTQLQQSLTLRYARQPYADASVSFRSHARRSCLGHRWLSSPSLRGHGRQYTAADDAAATAAAAASEDESHRSAKANANHSSQLRTHHFPGDCAK